MPRATMSVEDQIPQSLERIRVDFQHEFALMKSVSAFAHRIVVGPQVITSELHRPTLQLVATILTKSCKTFRAIDAVARVGCGQDASILLRALFESTIAVLYILQRDSNKRAVLFAAHEQQRRLVMIESMRSSPEQKDVYSDADLAKARANVQRWNALATAEEVSAVRYHWSGLRGLEEATKALGPASGWHRLYNTLYRHTSGFSHGSDISTHVLPGSDPAKPVLKLLPGDDELALVLPTACRLLLAMCNELDRCLSMGVVGEIRSLAEQVGVLEKARANRAKGV